MKKISIILSLIMGILIFSGNLIQVNGSPKQEEIASKIIRFHVLANSDSAEDQALKLKVRDKVLQYIAPKLKQCKSIDESREILKANDENIKKIAEETIKANGYTYKATTMLSTENFPVKTYGNITLPQGKYEAYRILIGSAKGQNWWCVMFPPLCFVDITKGEVSYNETKKEMKQVLSKEEYEAVDNSNMKKEKDKEIRQQNINKVQQNKIEVRFKIVDLIEKAIKEIEKK